MATLSKILNSIDCDLLITAVQRSSPEMIRKEQALKKAKNRLMYLQGTMSLERQDPSKELLEELIEEEVMKILNSPNSKLWEEER